MLSVSFVFFWGPKLRTLYEINDRNRLILSAVSSKASKQRNYKFHSCSVWIPNSSILYEMLKNEVYLFIALISISAACLTGPRSEQSCMDLCEKKYPKERCEGPKEMPSTSRFPVVTGCRVVGAYFVASCLTRSKCKCRILYTLNKDPFTSTSTYTIHYWNCVWTQFCYWPMIAPVEKIFEIFDNSSKDHWSAMDIENFETTFERHF